MQAARPIEGETVYRWEWVLGAPPEKVWPYVSDTQRVNRAIGLAATTFTATPDPRGGSTRRGAFRYLGLSVEWDEHPYEWVAPREMGVVRNYRRGPLSALRSHVTLEPDPAGTRLVHTVGVRARGFIGSIAAALEVGRKTYAGLDRVYRGFERYLAGQAALSFPPEPVDLLPDAPRVVEKTRSRLAALGFEPTLAERLFHHLTTESDREVVRIRPFALARRWSVDRIELLRMCLHATKEGLLEMSWDLVCPSCKGAPSSTVELSRIQTDAHCEWCNVRFDAQFDSSVEVTFRPSPAVRSLTVAEYCLGGPGNTRHIVAQGRVLRGATEALSLLLEPGLYRLSGAKKPGEIAIEVKPDGAAELAVTTGAFPAEAALAPTSTLRVTNADDVEHTISLERLAWKEDVASGAVVTCLQEFRDMFSSQVFAPDTKIGISTIALLFTDLKSSTAMYEKVGDAVAFALVRDHFKLLFESVTVEQGGLVKTIGDAVMASFPRPVYALRAALHMHEQIAAFNEHEKPAFPVRLKIGLHAGPCIAVNLNDRLDYFGTTVNMAARIQNESHGDDIVLLDTLAQDPEVARVLDATTGRRETFEAELKGLSGKFTLLRFFPERGTPPPPKERTSTRFRKTNLFG